VKFSPARQRLKPAAGKEGPSLQYFAERNEFMFRKFLKDESGLELSEYAVAAALVAVATIAAFQLVGTNIGLRISTLAGYIK
jgi:pilus assembly protein Flp/PilA